ncbi:MAG: YicC family protein [Phycisphaerae bacterium]|nr:YicC family protein [Phycisphaerae bacterium]
MLQSMTGFGDSQHESDGFSFLIEVKTVNNRFLKTSIKLPDVLAFAEMDIERLIRDGLARGSVNYNLHMRQTDTGGALEVNQAAVQSYIKSLQQVRSLVGESKDVTINLSTILQLPGSCQAHEYSEEEHQGFLEIVKSQTLKALERVRKMRTEEGKTIVKDLQGQCSVIKENLDGLANMTAEVVNNYRQRIQLRVNDMLSGQNLKIDEEQLAREVAVFAERSDINEEISRLNSHLNQFEAVCHSDEQIGRRLDFLTQEMLREANTITSKANNAKISHHVVEIKVAIDRLREQVQNVE